MYSNAELLLFPEASTVTKRTEWTALVQVFWNDYIQKKHCDAGARMPQWVAGKHYTVIEPTQDEYYTFLSESRPTYEVFRHRWVIVRNRRPHVPVLEGNRLPGPSTGTEDKAKYCSLFFRPWSLIFNTSHVPYLPNMGFPRGVREEACLLYTSPSPRD